MARFLCIWELGSNLGHLMNLKMFIETALANGHQVSLACKELHNLPQILPTGLIDLYQAPYLWRKPPKGNSRMHCYADITASRFNDHEELGVLCNAWENIFKATRPDIVVYDHAPSALIASLNKPWLKWVIGSAFILPGCDGPNPGIFPGTGNTEESQALIKYSNSRLLELTNRQLEKNRMQPIDNTSYIFLQADRHLLLTTPEMDYYAPRLHPEATEYLGIEISSSGSDPIWPQDGRYRIFGYLDDFPALEKLLHQLNRKQLSVLIYGPKIPPETRKRFPQISFSQNPLNMRAVAREANLFVNMGNHATCLLGMLANIPQLMIPTHQEQAFNARQVARHGKGVVMNKRAASVDDPVNRAFNFMQQARSLKREIKDDIYCGKLLKNRIEEIIGAW